MNIDLTTLRRSIALLMHVAYERYQTERLQLLAELCLTLVEVSDLNTLVRSYRLIIAKAKVELDGKNFEYPLIDQLEHVLCVYEPLVD